MIPGDGSRQTVSEPSATATQRSATSTRGPETRTSDPAGPSDLVTLLDGEPRACAVDPSVSPVGVPYDGQGTARAEGPVGEYIDQDEAPSRHARAYWPAGRGSEAGTRSGSRDGTSHT